MPATVIDGKLQSERVAERVKTLASELNLQTGKKPGLAVVLVGDDAASQVYVGAKTRKAAECGFHSVQHTLPSDTTEDQLAELVDQLNADPTIHGILVQLPLPDGINAPRIIQSISAEKDVDGFHFLNVGMVGVGEFANAFVPCTPAGAMLLIEQIHGRDLSGLNAVVVGRSNIVGKPMANLLIAHNATVTIAHSRTKDLPGTVRQADIVVAAVGRPHLIKGDWLKPGATVIDVGINRVPAPDQGENKFRLVGDVDYAEAAQVAGAITPVPGGVGPMTISLLMANTLVSAYREAGLPKPSFSLDK